MRKTTIEFDEATEKAVEQVLGTRGLKATVDRSFRTVLALGARLELIEQLKTMDGLDLDDREIMAKAWAE